MSSRLLFLSFFISFYLSAFSQTTTSQNVKKQPESTKSQDNYVQILWLDKKGILQFNEDYIKTLTDPQRAALGYITTSVCW